MSADAPILNYRIPGPKGSGFHLSLRRWWGSYPVTQLGIFLGLAAIFWLLGSNMLQSMQRLGITPGFGFLGQSANFAIGESLIAYSPSDTFGRAALVGLLNTVAIAISGCILATILGVFLGIARLSGNVLLAGLVRIYVEVLRNTPLLLQLFFWSAVTHALPAPRRAFSVFEAIFLSNRGIFVPSVGAGNLSLATLLVSAGLCVVSASYLSLWRRAGNAATMTERAGILLLTVIGVGLVFRLSSVDVRFEIPVLKGFNVVGGFNLTPEFAALLIGLVVNSSATIAEIVRSGIQSVPSGQWEAARSLGLQPARIMRLVVLPQALRVIIPLMTSSYLDLTKNSSLAVAIGFPDLVSVLNTTANQSGQALEALAIIVVCYLTFNLSVSAVMNWYNKRIERQGYLPR
jgi:general L-amino acid transport system permease protein